MSTMIAIAGIFFILGISIAYMRGYNTGKRDGIEEGRAEGEREASEKAFAVGYDRGKHDREVEEQEEEEPPPKKGCITFVIAVFLPTLIMLVGLILRA